MISLAETPARGFSFSERDTSCRAPNEMMFYGTRALYQNTRDSLSRNIFMPQNVKFAIDTRF